VGWGVATPFGFFLKKNIYIYNEGILRIKMSNGLNCHNLKAWGVKCHFLNFGGKSENEWILHTGKMYFSQIKKCEKRSERENEELVFSKNNNNNNNNNNNIYINKLKFLLSIRADDWTTSVCRMAGHVLERAKLAGKGKGDLGTWMPIFPCTRDTWLALSALNFFFFLSMIKI
jgi:hypothetical protein